MGGSSPLGKSWQTAQPPGPGRALQEDEGAMDQTGNKSMERSLLRWCSTVRLQLGTAWLDPKPKKDVSCRVPKIEEPRG